MLDVFKETKRLWMLKHEVLDCSIWVTCFGRVCGTVVRQTTWWQRRRWWWWWWWYYL